MAWDVEPRSNELMIACWGFWAALRSFAPRKNLLDRIHASGFYRSDASPEASVLLHWIPEGAKRLASVKTLESFLFGFFAEASPSQVIRTT
jgi:hypothetical protein